jgi:Fur family transcriptional regulator, ferric uptake regulator
MDERIRTTLDNYLVEKGLRKTKQRDVIVETIFGSEDHFTAEELVDKVKRADDNASRATVYRTLSLLTECGLLREIDLGREHTYYDPNFLDRPQHNHLICVDCHKVVEFEDEHIALLEDCITRRLGFKPTNKSMRIEATCEELAKNGTCTRRKN